MNGHLSPNLKSPKLPGPGEHLYFFALLGLGRRAARAATPAFARFPGLRSWDRFEEWTFLANANGRDSRVKTGKRFCRRIDMLGKLHRYKKNCCLRRILKQRLPVLNSGAEFF